MDIFLIWIGVIILAPMVLGPLVVKFNQWVSPKFIIQTVPVESLDHEVRAFLEKAKDEFESTEFEFIGYMTMADYMPNMSTFFAMFIDGQSKRSAMAAVIKHKSGRTAAYYEFAAKYSNGRVINVSNSPMKGTYRNPEKSSYRYPKIKSVMQLNEIHRWITGHDRKATDPVVYDKDRAADMLADALKKELRLQETFGYFTMNEEKGRFQFTWKGAFVMTEMNAFPIKNILVALDLAAAGKAIEGMLPDPADGAARRAGKAGKKPAFDAGLKDAQHFKMGASWFYWIAALTLINSLAMKFGSSWNFVVGLGTTQVIDSIGMSVKEVSPDIVFQVLILLLDLGFAALFVVFGLMAQKRSLDCFEVGMVFYAVDSLVFLLGLDIPGIILHGIALFFLYRGWKGLRKLHESQTRLAPVPG